jgi:hypothetical protein
VSRSVEEIEKAVVVLADLWRGNRFTNLPLPNLIGVGSGRCGTSYLYGLLHVQKDVYVTPVKEANYFGVASRRHMSLREYSTFFAAREDQKWVADITPVYLYAPRALEEIRDNLEQPRIIVTLRNPLGRMASHFKFHKKLHGFADFGSYAAAALDRLHIDTVSNWASPAQGIRMSLYAKRVEKALQLFGAENCLILLYEDLAADPQTWASKLEAFLDVPIDASLANNRFRNSSDGEAVDMTSEAVERVMQLFAADAMALEPLIGPVARDWAEGNRARTTA